MNIPDQSTLITVAVLVGGFLLAGKAIRRVGALTRLALTAVGLLVAIMIFGPLVENAFAAEPTPPVLTCGSTVEWSLTTVGAPSNSATALKNVWSQIEAATGVHGKKVNESSLFGNGGGKITWYWRYPGGGFGADPIDEDNSAITEVTHQHLGDLAGTAVALPQLNQMLLRDLGRDLGLPSPIQGTGGKLTKADLAALKTLCAAKKVAPAGSAVATTAPDVTQAVDTPATVTAPVTHPITSRDKVIGYVGSAAAAGVFALILFAGRIRKYATGRGLKVPSRAAIKGWFQQLRARARRSHTKPVRDV